LVIVVAIFGAAGGIKSLFRQNESIKVEVYLVPAATSAPVASKADADLETDKQYRLRDLDRRLYLARTNDCDTRVRIIDGQMSYRFQINCLEDLGNRYGGLPSGKPKQPYRPLRPPLKPPTTVVYQN
jgi:hypothetical protein